MNNQTPIRPAVIIPVPIDAYLAQCEDEVVIVLDNGNSYLIVVRKLTIGGYENIVEPPPQFWGLWRYHKGGMKALGFSVHKTQNKWRIVFDGRRWDQT